MSPEDKALFKCLISLSTNPVVADEHLNIENVIERLAELITLRDDIAQAISLYKGDPDVSLTETIDRIEAILYPNGN